MGEGNTTLGGGGMKKRRTELTIERRELLVVRRPTMAGLIRCQECCSRSRVLIVPEEAAVMAGVSTRAVYRWVEAGAVHFAETPGGGLLVCPDSLPTGDGIEQLLRQGRQHDN
jgi:hypothetical protein